MRVIAGTLRSRAIRAPKGDGTRPTSDRVREALFAVLEARGCFDLDHESLRVLDLFAGSGALAIEAISRGATTATCIEQNRNAMSVLRTNLEELGLTSRVQMIQAAVREGLRRLVAAESRFELVFVDPPYAMVKSLGDELALIRQVFPPLGGLLIVEHATRDVVPPLLGFTAEETRRWGDTSVTILTAVGSSSAGSDPAPQ